MKEHRTEQEEYMLYLACLQIRNFILTSNKSRFHNPLKILNKESEIYQMINNHDWENLFKDHRWIKIIFKTRKLNGKEEKISEYLEIIKNLIPKEKELAYQAKQQEKKEKKEKEKRKIKELKNKIDKYQKIYFISFPKGSY